LNLRACGVGSPYDFISKVDITFKIINTNWLVVGNFFSHKIVVSKCLHKPL
jgi:hypothetical protein